MANHGHRSSHDPDRASKTVKPDAELWTALEEMDRDGVNQLPVMVDGQIQGMLSREDIISYLRTFKGIRCLAYGPAL